MFTYKYENFLNKCVHLYVKELENRNKAFWKNYKEIRNEILNLNGIACAYLTLQWMIKINSYAVHKFFLLASLK